MKVRQSRRHSEKQAKVTLKTQSKTQFKNKYKIKSTKLIAHSLFNLLWTSWNILQTLTTKTSCRKRKKLELLKYSLLLYQLFRLNLNPQNLKRNQENLLSNISKSAKWRTKNPKNLQNHLCLALMLLKQTLMQLSLTSQR